MAGGSVFEEIWRRLAAWRVHDDRGATAAEYALLLALILVVIVVAVKGFGPVLSDLFSRYPDLSTS